MRVYPHLVLPDLVETKEIRELSLREARQFKDWLMSVKDARVEDMLEYLGVESNSNPEELLLDAAKRAVKLFKVDPFSSDGPNHRSLTNTGAALAADLGLLVAKLLVDLHGDKLEWTVSRKSKREVNYNRPVLEGFTVSYLEPIGVSMALASGVLRGNRDENNWKELFVYCRGNVPGYSEA